MVVGEPLVVEQVVAKRHAVRAKASRRQEVLRLSEVVFVVPLLRVADTAERVGPVPRIAAASVEQRRTAYQIGKTRPRSDEALVPIRIASFDKEIRCENACVVDRR